MKKFAAVILVLALSILFGSAFAEIKTFGMSGVTDLDGNITYLVLENNVITDGEGNPVDDVPYITLVIDDEALTFVACTASEAIIGTIEVLDVTDSDATVQMIPEEGEAFTAVYSNEEVDSLTLIDEANDMMVVMYEETIAR